MGDVRYHIVHSAKGGCGKSLCSLILTMMLNMKQNEDVEQKNKWKKDRETKACLIDADFRSTGLEITLFETLKEDNFIYFDEEKNEPYPEFNIKKNSKYYNDLLIDQKRYDDNIFTRCICEIKRPNVFNEKVYLPDERKNDIEHEKNKYINDMAIEKYPKDEAYCKYFAFDVCFCNPKSSSKIKFTPHNNGMDGSLITNSYFKHSFKQFLKFLEDKKKYSDIIIDLPPTFDEYVDVIYDIMFDVSDGKIKDDDANLYLVTTFDKAHIYSNLEYLKSLITRYTFKNQVFNNIKIIINDINNDFKRLLDDRIITKDPDGKLITKDSDGELKTNPSNESIKRHLDVIGIIRLIAIFDNYFKLMSNNPRVLCDLKDPKDPKDSNKPKIALTYNPYNEEFSKFVSIINPIYYGNINKLKILSYNLFDFLVKDGSRMNYNLLEVFYEFK